MWIEVGEDDAVPFDIFATRGILLLPFVVVVEVRVRLGRVHLDPVLAWWWKILP